MWTLEIGGQWKTLLEGDKREMGIKGLKLTPHQSGYIPQPWGSEPIRQMQQHPSSFHPKFHVLTIYLLDIQKNK